MERRVRKERVQVTVKKGESSSYKGLRHNKVQNRIGHDGIGNQS